MNFDMTWLTGAGIAAAAAAAGAFWSQARGLLKQVSGLLFYVNTVNGSMSYPLASHLKREYRRLPSGVATIRNVLVPLKGYSVKAAIPYAMPAGPTIWWGAHGLFVVTPSSDGCTIVSPRVLSRPFRLLADASRRDLEIRNSQDLGNDRFFVQRVLGSAGSMDGMRRMYGEKSEDTLSSSAAPIGSGELFWEPDIHVDHSFAYDRSEFDLRSDREQAFRGLAFDSDIENLLKEIQQWMDKRDFYLEHSIPHRMGIQLVGPGGTGKSSLVKATAQQLRIPLYQYHLNTLTDKEFMNEWDGMQVPCVVALEDFDTVFHGREPVTIHKSLSFECVLNQISGISASQGILLFVTTNDPSKIDPAMGQIDENGRPTRPGRIDRILYMGTTSVKQRQKIADMVLGWAPSPTVSALIKDGEGTTAAQFQSMCITEALKRLSIGVENDLQ